MVVEPYADMVGAPMGGEFFDACERIDPDIDALHRRVALECVAAVLGNQESAELFLLALDGLLGDGPTVPVLERRIRLLADKFIESMGKRRKAVRR